MPPPSDIVCLDADDMTCLMYGVGILYGRRQYGIVTAKLVATTQTKKKNGRKYKKILEKKILF